MATKVIMPNEGPQMLEGTILKRLFEEGQTVEKDAVLLEIETDKVTAEVKAPASGVLLKILREEGAVVPITETIAILGEPGEDISALL